MPGKKKHVTKNPLYKRWWFWLIIVLVVAGAAGQRNSKDNEPKSSSASSQVEPTPLPTTEPTFEPTQAPAATPAPTSSPIPSELMKGRGMSDSGRSEPNYVGVDGYVVLSLTEQSSLERNDSCYDTPWMIPIYKKDKQFYVDNGSVEHKTEVVVTAQELTHEGWGSYSGYLTVNLPETGEEVCINVNNFITKDYWSSLSLEDAASVGYYIAEYRQESDYWPVDRGGDKVELDEGMRVLVTGLTGTYGKGGPDQNITPITGKVFKEWSKGYGGVDVFFCADDLTLIY